MNDLSDIWDIIDEANASNDLQVRQRQLEIAIRQLNQLLQTGDARPWYPLGYAYYCHPNRRDRYCLESIETVRSLNNAILNNVEESLSHLYLAYHYFDFLEFTLAKYHIDQVVSEELEETMRLRHAELVACISICRLGFENACAQIREYAKLVLSLPGKDVPPILLLNTIEVEAIGKIPASKIRDGLKSLDMAYADLGGVFNFLRLPN